ncbi:MAG: acyl-CoA dehydrogenase family protein [Pseudomonadota bacterium]
MYLLEQAEDRHFRDEVRRFMRENLPASLRRKSFTLQKPDKADLVNWHRTLHRHGWGAPSWPIEFGGTGWTAVQQKIFEEESMMAGGPRYMPQVNMIGPVLQRFGTKAQQDRFMSRLITLDDWWCQGYSEPEAGSDLGSLRTRARREGDNYIVTGQKIWTSGAPWADWMFALVRTSDEGRPNEGISFLLIDMKSPGIEANWIKGIDGGGTLAEVFLTDVKVPVANLVHEENKGWTVAKYLLDFERLGQAAIGHCKFLLLLLKRLASRPGADRQIALRDMNFRRRVASAEIELMAHEWTLLRVLSSSPKGAQFSILKNRGAEIQQLLIELMLECVGADLLAPAPEKTSECEDPLPDAAAVAAAFLDMRKVSIFAGTTEVQKNIIAKSLLA